MWVSRLLLRNFRSYPQLSLDLQPGVTTFVAPNGWGKTNLVESIGYLAALRSHRVAGDQPLVRTGAEQATISALAHRGPRQVTLEVTIRSKGANLARINRSPVRARDVLGLVRAVVFAPENLALVKGDPAERRQYLDDLLIARQPRFAGVIADHQRALRQRNALLKSLRSNRDPGLEATLDIWDEAFAEANAQLVLGRRQLLEELRAPVTAAFAHIASGAAEARQQVDLDYTSRLDYRGIDDARAAAEVVVAGLAQRRRVEIERGLTLVGAQRDDVELLIGGVPAKGYASHGESWSLALALQLAGWELLSGEDGSPDDQPVLVLDDVFAELDADRRRRLAERIDGAEQVLITAAVAGDIPDNLSGRIVDLPAHVAEAAGNEQS
ncbi:DNA replication/repair protein RecF [Brevibacterium luteolum]|uniref:DNA replication and repair protein RecF n=1 Tax=Brevibacterium luteolum TaxID=199591 RepID=A0A849AS69_9MICO|nr:DNA replication/repair protein RecF [Brevibacterium luteolum]MBM7530023.1 DNA replication and repair protein RecF [Brevibacterium luteolum]NNG78775.1 DNA replication/repair protein RecF [Brevibacterium luteolum]